MGRGSDETPVVSESNQRELVRVSPTLSLPVSEFSFRASRSSGPGGQHANKSETKIEASFDVLASQTLDDQQKQRLVVKIGPVVKAIAQDERSQYRNKELATKRVAELIAAGLKTRRKRIPTSPTASSQEKRLDEKRRRGTTKKLRQAPAVQD